MDELRDVLGAGPSDETLASLLDRCGGRVRWAANAVIRAAVEEEQEWVRVPDGTTVSTILHAISEERHVLGTMDRAEGGVPSPRWPSRVFFEWIIPYFTVSDACTAASVCRQWYYSIASSERQWSGVVERARVREQSARHPSQQCEPALGSPVATDNCAASSERDSGRFWTDWPSWHQARVWRLMERWHLCPLCVSRNIPNGGLDDASAPAALPPRVWPRLPGSEGDEVEDGCASVGPSPVILPVVFGFPSEPIIQAWRGVRCCLGGDHVLEGTPVWQCGRCAAVWRAWPFLVADL